MTHHRYNHLTQECWLKLLVGKDDLEQLRKEHGGRLQHHLNELYRAYIARTTETLDKCATIGSVKH